MKQLIQSYRSGKLEVSEVPAPVPRDGAVLVATRNSLISAGTERSSAQMARKSLLGKALERPDLVRKVIGQIEQKGPIEAARMVFSRLDAPVAPGYSCAGIALEVGSDVDGIRAGDRVACAGQNHASHAEVVLIPKNLCVRIPDGVSFEDASYVAVGAIALQGIRQADPKLGEVVAVIGLGLLGQLTVQMLLANGCKVVASDIDPRRLGLARAAGATAVPADGLPAATAGLSDGRGADAVVITASTPSDAPVTAAAEVCRKRGRVVVVGAVGMDLPREPFYVKEIDFRLSTSYGPGRYDPEYEERGVDYPSAYVRWTERRNMDAFLALVQSGGVRPSQLTTHRFTIDRATEAYELLLDGAEPSLGVTLEYPSPPESRTSRTVTLARGIPTGAIRLGVIGAGNHVNDRLIPPLRVRREVEIRAVATATGMKARALAERYGAAVCTSDPQDILADPQINAVLIGTRHDSHAALVVQALSAGKHVFVEKPLCLNEQELTQVLEAHAAAASRGLLLMVGFNRRFSRHAVAIRAAFEGHPEPLVMQYRVNAGAIPAQHWIQQRSVGGGRLIGEGCHFIDLMQYVTGGLVRRVQASAIGRHSSGITSDHCAVCVELSDGSIGTLTYAAGGDAALAKERFEAFGNGCSVVLDDFQVTEIYRRGRRTRVRGGGQDKGFQQEMTAFCDAILQGGVPPISIEEIEAVTRACLVADRALRGDGQPVVTGGESATATATTAIA